jgi:hypothetical protein
VTALLPAISTGLKQSTATVDGLGNLFGVMAQQETCRKSMTPPRQPSAQKGLLLEMMRSQSSLALPT